VKVIYYVFTATELYSRLGQADGAVSPKRVSTWGVCYR